MEENTKKKNSLIYIGAAIAALVLAIVVIPKLVGIFDKDSKGNPVSHNVTLTAEGFDPKEITVKKGDVIVWTNNSGKQASVNSADYPTHQNFPFLNLGLFENGQTLQTPFNEVGEYEYVSRPNKDHTGKVTVTN